MVKNLSKQIHCFLFGPPRRNLLLVLFAIFVFLTSFAAGLIYFKPSQEELEINGYKQSNPTATRSATPSSKKAVDKDGNPVPGSGSGGSSSSGSFGSSSGGSNPDSTPTPETLSATVVFYADTQTDSPEDQQRHQVVVNYILGTSASTVFHAGDLMEDGTQTSLDYFNSATSTLRSARTFYAALGNNDRVVGDPNTPSPLWFANFTFPGNEQWYSVNIGNLHMVILDSAFSASNPSQTSWLISDLQSSASQSRITGVMYHHPTFSSTVGSYFRDYGVDFVIAGHLHSYSHSVSDGVHYFVMSGQTSIGYCLARIYSNYVQFTAYNSGNGAIETITVNKR